MKKTEDTVVIALLRENSRRSLTEMSRLTKIPVSTLYERLKEYNKGLIRKHTSLIDFAQLGFAARARVLLKVKKPELARLKEHLLSSPYVNDLYKVNNGYDFMAEFVFRTMQEMEEHLDMLAEKYAVEKEEVFYIVDELRREEFLSKAKVLTMGETQ